MEAVRIEMPEHFVQFREVIQRALTKLKKLARMTGETLARYGWTMALRVVGSNHRREAEAKAARSPMSRSGGDAGMTRSGGTMKLFVNSNLFGFSLLGSSTFTDCDCKSSGFSRQRSRGSR